MAKQRGILALEDGTLFHGFGFGAETSVVGEACFNTSLTGYQEILTDPSYYAQIVTMTAPMIGNYGINPDDAESDGPKVAGFVIRELSPITSNWRSLEDLSTYLRRHGIAGLERIDTRALTKRLRVQGALKACLSTDPSVSPDEAVDRARGWAGLVGVDNVQHVTASEIHDFIPADNERGPFTVPGTKLKDAPDRPRRYKVAAYDFGAKRSIYRKLAWHGFDVTVVPAKTPASEVRALNPDALFLSNGPGDPAPLTYAHQAAQELIQAYPTFGICLGHQILTHALGAETFKLKFGHRGGNQPVKNMESGRVSITSQNHGFASTADELRNKGAVVTELNLNDQTVEGLRLADLPVFSVQYHPEAAPGPNDADPLFDAFYEMVDQAHR
ncbi:MAG: glutamine-hydrolyzing carbamoyl-phosphate synthase small subunit [Opitutales bacterium]